MKLLERKKKWGERGGRARERETEGERAKERQSELERDREWGGCTIFLAFTLIVAENDFLIDLQVLEIYP